jgi:hypothetical protein
MNKHAQVLEEFIKREDIYADYNLNINGVVLYSVIRRYIRVLYCGKVTETSNESSQISKKGIFINTLRSLWQLLKLFISNKRYKNFIYSFFRVDKINDLFIDKFTDPLIDYSDIKNSYIIFEHHKDGVHKVPRIHSEKVIFTDAIDVFATVYARFMAPLFMKKHKKELDKLWISLDKLLGNECKYNKMTISRLLIQYACLAKIYLRIFCKVHAKNIFAPARSTFLPLVYAAKKRQMISFELQHGILNSVGISFSGHVDENFTPDYFLSYGELVFPEYYGIPKERIINIGWPLPEYINNLKNEEVLKNAILIPSNPFTTKQTIAILCDLAKNNPNIDFYFRLHPLERIPKVLNDAMSIWKNIHIQDNSQNYTYVLSRFSMVMGDNSTTLDEAYSAGKKVGRFSYEGFVPMYINDDVKKNTWQIYDNESFKTFFSAENSHFKRLNIYSPFNPQLVNTLVNQGIF